MRKTFDATVKEPSVALYDEVWEYFRRAHEPALGRLRNATLLAPSPDGRRIVFGGRMLEKLEGTPHEALGVIDAATGAVQGLDTLPGSASRPAWSPGGTLAYVSGGSQIVVGGGALNLGFDGVIEEIAWSADSRYLLVRVAGRAADAPGAAGSGTVAAPQNRHASWQPYVEGALPENAWRRAYAIDASTGAAHWHSPAGDNVWEAVWCGPGAVAAVVSSDPSESSWYRSHLVTYAIDGSRRRDLYAPREECGVPAASPDGRYVTLIEACCSDRTMVAGEITLFDTHDPVPQPRAIPSCGADVTYAVWPTPHRLFFIGIRRLEIVAGEYDVRAETARELWSTRESAGADFPLAWPAGDGFVTVVDSYGRYQRILHVENGNERLVCDLAHAGTDFIAQNGGRAEPVTWKARDGLEIDGFLVRPAGEPPYPLIVNVHGGPVFSFRNDWSLHYYYVPVFAKYGYAVLNPNPRGSRGRGQAFARMVRGDMCGEDAHDIMRGVEAMIERGIADPKRIAVTGRSYGGYMSSWLITQTQAFAAAMPMAPVTNNFSHHWTANIPEFNRRFLNDHPYRIGGMYAARSPVFFADRAKTPALSMGGGRDRCTPAGQAMEFHRALAENGVPCELVIYPEEGHHIERIEAQCDQMARMLDWLNRFMPKKPMS